MRAYTQASGRPARAGILDLIDGLLLSGTYDMAKLGVPLRALLGSRHCKPFSQMPTITSRNV